MVAFNSEGKIEAVQFLDNDETPGLGQKVKDEAFSGQFAGKDAAPLTLGTDIDASSLPLTTGATVSSRAAANAVNKAIEAYGMLQAGTPAAQEVTGDEG